MAVEINRPGSGFGRRPKLSRLGKIVAAALAAAAVLAAVLIVGGVRAAQQREALSRPVLDAIEHSVLVCRGVSDTDDELSRLTSQVAAEKDVEKKAALAQDMILRGLTLAHGNQSETDELNGARNRITVALRQYRAG